MQDNDAGTAPYSRRVVIERAPGDPNARELITLATATDAPANMGSTDGLSLHVIC